MAIADRGICPDCGKETALKAGKIRQHRIRNMRGKLVICSGVGEYPSRVINSDPAMQIGRIATIHETTVSNAPQLVGVFGPTDRPRKARIQPQEATVTSRPKALRLLLRSRFSSARLSW